jgi:hypothetical protein
MIKEKKNFFIKRGIQSGGFLQFIIPAIISAIGVYYKQCIKIEIKRKSRMKLVKKWMVVPFVEEKSEST